ncbi:hypothetical protein [Enterococcus sp. 7E2_DIV0204]|uniref:hypothetical protein n=1 Tax=Enterococcus sp. 7E2_DIV0204 TaxID=1834188 RepID=UPI0015941368|nr:hypothetical protein [Enterococcus sp. 7E2_DIV0204]
MIFQMMTYPFEETHRGKPDPEAILEVAKNLKDKNKSFQPSIDGLDPRGFNPK